MKVGYNAAALSTFNKDVYVKLAGISQPKVLKITGEVLDAAAYDDQSKSIKATPAKTSKPATTKKS
jgi:hypothetical protein